MVTLVAWAARRLLRYWQPVRIDDKPQHGEEMLAVYNHSTKVVHAATSEVLKCRRLQVTPEETCDNSDNERELAF